MDRRWRSRGQRNRAETHRAWVEVVTFGLEIWTLAAVEEALAENVAIPELLRLTELSVRLPLASGVKACASACTSNFRHCGAPR